MFFSRIPTSLLSIILTFSFLSSCISDDNWVDQFEIHPSNIQSKISHHYVYDEYGRIKTRYTTSANYVFGMLADSGTSVYNYTYNEKGQTTLILNPVDSSRQYYIYNDSDSLIADYRINSYQDTTFLRLTEYSSGQKTQKFERILVMRWEEDSEEINYDTIFIIKRFIYDQGRLASILHYDKDRNIIEEEYFFYENGEIIQHITRTPPDFSISSTTYYLTRDSDEPDLVILGVKGDTLRTKRTYFHEKNRIKVDHFPDEGITDVDYYNEDGRLEKNAIIDYNENLKILNVYSRDSFGNVIEKAIYREKLTADLVNAN